MKKYLFTAALALALASGVHAADNDPVLMTVDGHPVRVSEFEYLYNKNNSQQAQQQSLQDYLQMFIDYKLKVADAEHEGLQNTPEFLNEYNNFRAELSTPYMRIQEVEDKLVDEAYSHRKEDVYVSHIMLQGTPDDRVLADSIRTAILDGSMTYEDAARKYSIDRNSSIRGGLMGYVIPGRFPWAFEEASYNLQPGEISDVVNSGMGYHIIRMERRTPAAGEVSASHILLTTRGKSEAEAEKQHARIDSIYTVLMSGADFADMATRFSEDPGSAKNGGSLGWFTRGAMVPEFDSTAFALKDGEISKPFTTAFGYHIIKRFDHRDVPALDEVRDDILASFKRDARGKAAEKAYLDRLMKEKNAQLDNRTMEIAAAEITRNGGLDSVAVAQLKAMNMVAGTYDGGKLMLNDVLDGMSPLAPGQPYRSAGALRNIAQADLEQAVLDIDRTRLAEDNADYRNLLNEYRDGILLYEISNRNVWDKAAKDTDGLNKFFKQNAAKYKWESPKFKSYVIFTTNDSILNAAVAYADSLTTAGTDNFARELRKRFGRDIKIERVIAAKGENAITDYLAFGGEKPEAESTSKWQSYAAYQGRILDAPEEAADVRGAAVTDYQALLDREWVKQLRKRYKVKVDKKVFEKLLKENTK